MALFSLEFDGYANIMDFTDDPFINAGISQSQNRKSGSVVLDPQYSDISDDDDFQLQPSQFRMPPRYLI